MSVLTPDDFSAFFREVHGCEPFPWQRRLAARIAEEGKWPDVLDLPTGSGKTAAIDVAVFHLAAEADWGPRRRAPVRIAFVVDRRLIVDDAFERARKIEAALHAPVGPATARIRERLQLLAGDNSPLVARRLRGGIPREDDWARTPAQPTILCSTVDQIGSRLLFRGYGVSDRMKPVHAGLIGSDCLILLDEAHLAEPFRQTLAWVNVYRGPNWRDPGYAHQAPWGVSLLTATPGDQPAQPFGLAKEDHDNGILAARWAASKKARLIGPTKVKTRTEESGGDESDEDKADLVQRVVAIADEVGRALARLREGGTANPAIGVVVNRVARARAVHQRLMAQWGVEIGEAVLLIGPARPVDRDDVSGRLDPIRTGAPRRLERPLVIVATQCIEAGVDIDLDGLVTEAAPLDALRQRFGRLNRAGRPIAPYASIVAAKSDLSPRKEDPVYGAAIRAAWVYLDGLAEKPALKGEPPVIDLGLAAFEAIARRQPVPKEALSPKADAPVLLPAHLDLLSQTSPVPSVDPEAALYLHGPNRQPASVSVLWRADVVPGIQKDSDTRRLLTLLPPRSAETIELPLWVVRDWLEGNGKAGDRLADVPVSSPEDEMRRERDGSPREVFRWAGDDECSAWIAPSEIRPGDTVVVPAEYGGVDDYGWNPDSREPAWDVADRAAEPFIGRRFVVRVAPELLCGAAAAQRLAGILARANSRRWTELRDAIRDMGLPSLIAEQLDRLDQAKGRGHRVDVYLDAYGLDDEERPRGVVFVAPLGLKGGGEGDAAYPAATEDDASGSLAGFTLSLEEHSADVERKAEQFARLAGLPEERVLDLRLAGYLHDAGKADRRFQAWLYSGDPLGADPDHVLAKSARPLPRDSGVRAGLPERWRHEALSVRLAPFTPRFSEARDPDLVLWLIGTHHGYGRPFFPHADPHDNDTRRDMPPAIGLPPEIPPGLGPQALAYDWNGFDWPALYERLKARYGVWELARMEAILRLADHRASEDEAACEMARGDEA